MSLLTQALSNGTLSRLKLSAKQWSNLKEILVVICPSRNYLWKTIDAPAFDFVDIDLMMLLHAIAPPSSETILGCGRAGTWIRDCNKLFRIIYTDQGLCYTFNGIAPAELYRNNVWAFGKANENHEMFTVSNWTLLFYFLLVNISQILFCTTLADRPPGHWKVDMLIHSTRTIIHLIRSLVYSVQVFRSCSTCANKIWYQIAIRKDSRFDFGCWKSVFTQMACGYDTLWLLLLSISTVTTSCSQRCTSAIDTLH